MQWDELKRSPILAAIAIALGLVGLGVVIGFSIDRADSWPERLRPLWWMALPMAFRVLLIRYNPDPVYGMLQPIRPINAALIATATGIVAGVTLVARDQGSDFAVAAGLAIATVFAGVMILTGWLMDWARSKRT